MTRMAPAPLFGKFRPELRVTLDAIRTLAAGYVVVHHLAIRNDPGVFEPFLHKVMHGLDKEKL